MEKLEHIPAYLRDQFLAELLEPSERAAVEAHLESCDHCSQEFADADSDRQAFLVAHAPEAQAHAIVQRAGPKSRSIRSWLIPAVSVPLAVAATILFTLTPPAPQEPDILFKGAAVTFAIVSSPTFERRAADAQEVLRPKDSIQISVNLSEPTFVTVYGLDYKGRLAQVFAESVQKPGDIKARLVVDEDPNPERLFVVFSGESLDFEKDRRSVIGAFQDTKSLDGFLSFPLSKGAKIEGTLLVLKATSDLERDKQEPGIDPNQ
jgi:hypothetical protein